ncbi:MAG: Shikimate dehydrogenase (NADP(+)) [Chlamydiia bacterium]|nr:Shikimate dehydrogenase (NADP(+)) [Chlamydiia bacterium]MCH9615628.1 Shikimate dehydrogenase (NADP(+)) [Chlamydiia bacterium]MCH9628969.1 Shikimate dehydrogenase (NADP(+)) [Chlamydiia bacterium]
MNVFVVTKPEITVKAEMYEFRLDLFERIDVDQVAKLMEGRRVILTHRSASLDELEALLELGPEYVDLDCATPESFLSRVKCKVICSYHNFDETPKDLGAIRLFDADEHKLATMANSTLDSLRMLNFVKEREHFTGICMGEDGQITRQLGPLVGSTFNFVNGDGQGSAPGQLSLDDLLPVDPKTKVYGLIGNPVTQSPSHRTHNKILQEAGENAVYLKMRVQLDEVTDFFDLMDPLPFEGLSVTIPLKEKVIEGKVVNTLKRYKGKWEGINTDGAGALDALEKKGSVKGKKVLVIGAGGAAKGIMAEAEKRGAEVLYYNRTEKDLSYRFLKDKEAVDFVINTTPVVEEIPFPEQWLDSRMVVMDISVKPKKTALLKKAEEMGCEVVYGTQMWVNQAKGQFHYWFDGRLDAQANRLLIF